MTAPTPALRGTRVLVTRPAHQAEPLCRCIEAAGGQPLRFPALTIGPPADPAALDAALDRLAAYDRLVFVSANAVHAFLDRLAAQGRPWPDGLRVWTVGGGTAAALERRGVAVAAHPAQGFGSDALLALPDTQALTGQRVLIVQGQRGRGVLQTTLRARGGAVDSVEAYRRLPPADPTPLRDWLRQRAIDVVTATSNQGLDQLTAAAGPQQPALLACPLAVLSPRTAEHARTLGFRHPPRVAADPTDTALMDAIAAAANDSERQR